MKAHASVQIRRVIISVKDQVLLLIYILKKIKRLSFIIFVVFLFIIQLILPEWKIVF